MHPVSPYSLNGATRTQLTSLTVSALKSHLKHFKLHTAGNKAALVDRLYSHLQTDTADDQQAGSTQADATTSQQTATNNPQQNPPAHQEQENSNSVLPQQMINQLVTILQQAHSTGAGDSDATQATLGVTEEDRLSAASVPVHRPNPTSSHGTTAHTSIQPVTRSALTAELPPLTPLLPQPVLPPTPARILEKIAKGEYIDFTTLLPKSMFGASESQPQSLTLQLNSSGENYSIQPPASGKKMTSFSAWMEAWNMYLAHRVSLNPSCAPYLIAYQRIITSASINHPLQAWVSYDVKFRTKAATDPSLRWDIRDLDLWLEHFPGTGAQPNR